MQRGRDNLGRLRASVECDSYASLRAFFGDNTGERAPAKAFTIGRSAAGDGGDGEWTWSTDTATADNDATVLVPTIPGRPRTGCWKRVFTDRVFNFLWWGPLANGATSDTARLLAAMRYINSIGGGTVYLPGGRTYALDNELAAQYVAEGATQGGISIWVANCHNVRIRGDGDGTVIKNVSPGAGGGYLFFLEGDGNGFESLKIDINQPYDGTAYSLNGPTFIGNRCFLEDVTIVNSAPTSKRTATSCIFYGSGNRVHNCRVYDAGSIQVHAYGGALDGGTIVSNCQIFRSDEMGIAGTIGGSPDPGVCSLILSGNYFEDVKNCAIYFGQEEPNTSGQYRNVLVTGNVVKRFRTPIPDVDPGSNVTAIGIRVGYAGGNIRITNNVLDCENGTGASGIRVFPQYDSGAACDGLAIEGNSVRNGDDWGVWVSGVAAKDLRISSNTIEGNRGVKVESAVTMADLAILGNSVRPLSPNGTAIEVSSYGTASITGRVVGNTVIGGGVAAVLARIGDSTASLDLEVAGNRIGGSGQGIYVIPSGGTWPTIRAGENDFDTSGLSNPLYPPDAPIEVRTRCRPYAPDTTSSPQTVTLPAKPFEGDEFLVYDFARNAGINAITVSCAGSVQFDDGTTSKTITLPGGFLRLVYKASTHRFYRVT